MIKSNTVNIVVVSALIYINDGKNNYRIVEELVVKFTGFLVRSSLMLA